MKRIISGALPEIHETFPEAPIYSTEIAVNGLKRHYPSLKEADFQEVKTGDTLNLGNKTLAFLDAFLLHWPDSMFTFLEEKRHIIP